VTRDVQVPQDLREMLAEFKKKIKEGGAKQHKGSGFGGRGFKFDTSEQVKHERWGGLCRAPFSRLTPAAA
jgi:hypothetical protein